jgi:serine/threonine-protein kinase
MDGVPELSSGRTAKESFGPYELLGELGRGGAGVVFRARQRSPDRTVALKVVSQFCFGSSRERQRFLSEAAIASRIVHRGIVPVYEIGTHEGRDYYTMELEEGGNLKDRLAEGPLEPRDAVKLLIQLCDAVHHAHEQGVVHRDLKPANVLFDTAGHPRISDFGLAKDVSAQQELTLTGEVVGTPSYMAPEQIAGSAEIGPATDVYALGCVLYTCLTGQPPIRAASVPATLHQILETPPVPTRFANPSVPRDLDAIALKCLEKRAEHRYPSARALADDLRAFLEGRPIQADDGRTNAFLRLLAQETRHTDVMARWSRIGMVHASLNLALFAATGGLLLAGVGGAWPYVALWVPGLTLATAVPVVLRSRQGPLTPIELQLSYVWGIFALSVAVAGLCQWLLRGSVFDLVPTVFVLAAFAIACMSVILRGSFYPLAIACGVCAVGSAFGPPWTMVPTGLALAGLHFAIALRAGKLRTAVED